MFDIGNVLIEWAPEKFFDAEIGADRRQQFFQAVPILAANAAIDRGARFPDAIVQLVHQYPDWEAEITLWHTRWLDMVSPEINQSVRLLRALRARGIPVFALSNFGEETFDIAALRYPFLAEFDQQYISGVMQMMIPDPAIYAAVEAGCGIAPGALLFADDLPQNIAVAEMHGWQVHLFEGPRGGLIVWLRMVYSPKQRRRKNWGYPVSFRSVVIVSPRSGPPVWVTFRADNHRLNR